MFQTEAARAMLSPKTAAEAIAACAEAACSCIRGLLEGSAEVHSTSDVDLPHSGPLVTLSSDSAPPRLKLALAYNSHEFGSICIDLSVHNPVLPDIATWLCHHPSLLSELETYAAITGTVLHSLFIESEVARADAASTTLADAARLSLIATRLSIDDILSRVVSLVHRTVDTEFVSLYLVNSAGRFIYCLLSDTPTFAQYKSRKQILRLKFGQGLPGTVAMTGKPVRVGLSQPRADSAIDAIAGVETRSALCVPVLGFASSGAGTIPVAVIIVSVKLPVKGDARCAQNLFVSFIMLYEQARNKLPVQSEFDKRDESALIVLSGFISVIFDACKRDMAFEEVGSFSGT